MRCRNHILVLAGWWLIGLAFVSPGQTQDSADKPTLVFDAESKRYDAAPGEQVARFTFSLTNVWTNEIIIDSVKPSCGCATTSLPATPWHLPPQGSGEIKAQISLAGKMGLVTKSLTNFYRLMPDNISLFHTVNLVVNIPPPPSSAGKLSEEERQAAMAKAKSDAQAIFKGDCAKCHADRGRDTFGEELFAVDCGICHESSRRDSLVPDLHALKQPTDFDYWKTVITFGKPRTMMPAFAATQGGPLTEAQIVSLATYLNHTISHNLTPAATHAAVAPLTPAAASR